MILLTGATGFVIANLARHLSAKGHEVLAADLNPPDPPLREFVSRSGNVAFGEVDVTDRDAVRDLLLESRPTRVVHGAAITSIPPEVERARFLRTVEVNVTGTLNVLDASREARVERVVVVSSGSIYGARPDLATISEEDPARPVELYPVTKWAAEALARRFADVHDMDVAVTRLASPFGPFERDTGSRPLLSSIREWTAAALRGENLRVLGPAPPPRDSVYVADIASGIATVLLAKRLPHRVYNVGWGRITAADDVLEALRRLFPGLRVERRPSEPSPWSASPARGPLSIDRLQQDLGWSPRYDLQSGLATYVEWARANPSVA
jgi:nucleoside-diphosphate-sugar epimerase